MGPIMSWPPRPPRGSERSPVHYPASAHGTRGATGADRLVAALELRVRVRRRRAHAGLPSWPGKPARAASPLLLRRAPASLGGLAPRPPRARPGLQRGLLVTRGG